MAWNFGCRSSATIAPLASSRYRQRTRREEVRRRESGLRVAVEPGQVHSGRRVVGAGIDAVGPTPGAADRCEDRGVAECLRAVEPDAHRPRPELNPHEL